MAKELSPKKNATAKNTTGKTSMTSHSPLTSGKGNKEFQDIDGSTLLLMDSLKKLLWVENHLLVSLPKMIESCYSKDLQNAISKHWEITKKHVIRLEKIFKILGKDQLSKKSDGMEGLTKEGECVIENTIPGTTSRDLGIIMASQTIEHYEISAYTGISKLAQTLGHQDISDILMQTLNEETESDNILTQIARQISQSKA